MPTITKNLYRGSTGSEVKTLQTILNSKVPVSKLPNGVKLLVDGIFGLKTYQAVEAFQSLNKLKIDGIVGNNTRSVLNKIYPTLLATDKPITSLSMRKTDALGKKFNISEKKCYINPAYSSGVYIAIRDRLKLFNIDIEKYIYIDPEKGSTLKAEKTVVEGISFVTKNIYPSIKGSNDLIEEFYTNKSSNGFRSFAGQISKENRENFPLQASYGATEGLGFREIFYLPHWVNPKKYLHNNNILLNQDNQYFDLEFGNVMDSPDVTSIHVAIGEETSIHLDKKGFIFGDRYGKLFTSSNVVQHVFDELLLKDKFLGLFDKNRPTIIWLRKNSTLLFDINHNSISDPMLSFGNQNDQFLQQRPPIRIMTGLELRHSSLFLRGTLGLSISNDRQLNIQEVNANLTAGIRKSF